MYSLKSVNKMNNKFGDSVFHYIIVFMISVLFDDTTRITIIHKHK